MYSVLMLARFMVRYPGINRAGLSNRRVDLVGR